MKKLKIVGYIAMVISFVFIVRSLLNMDIDFSYFDNPVMMVLQMIPPAFFVAMNCFIGGFAWRIILQFLSEKKERLALRPIMSVYTKSNIAKYMPGNVMHFAGRNLLGKELGLSQFSMLTATILEMVILLLTAGLLVVIFFRDSLITTFDFLISNPTYIKIALIVISVGIVCVILAVLYLRKKEKYVAIIKQIFSRRFIAVFCKTALCYTANFMITGFSFYYSFQYILGIDVNLGLIFSANIISWVVGYIIPGAPGGIGIKEAILALLLSGVYGKDMVLLGAIIQRIISILGDVIAFVINIVVEKLYRKD